MGFPYCFVHKTVSGASSGPRRWVLRAQRWIRPSFCPPGDAHGGRHRYRDRYSAREGLSANPQHPWEGAAIKGGPEGFIRKEVMCSKIGHSPPRLPGEK